MPTPAALPPPPSVKVVATCTVWAAGAAGDFASTRAAIRRGGTELNPLQRSLSAQIAVQSLTATLGCGLDLRLQRRGRRGLARGLRIAVLALKLGLVAHNLRQR